MICTGFYEKLSGNYCTRSHVMTQAVDSWCYVSSECTSLNGGGDVGTMGLMKWKQCKPEQDTSFGDMPPEELAKIAEVDDLNIGILAKFAYPLAQSVAWPTARICLLDSNNATLLNSVNATDCDTVNAIGAAGEGMIFDASDHMSVPYGIIFKSKVYELGYSGLGMMAQQDMMLGHMVPVSKLFEAKCVQGCSEGVAVA